MKDGARPADHYMVSTNPIAAPPPSSPPVQGGGDALRPVLPVVEGQVLAARVVSSGGGQVELAVAGQRLIAATGLPLEPGQTVRMAVQNLDPQRVAFQIVPGDADGEGAATGQAGARPGGLAPQTAQALFSALSQMGMQDIDGDNAQAALQRAAMAARAAQAGVSTPAQAAAFARLAAAGLPTTPAAVAGMATLSEGPPLGRMLAIITAPGGAAPPATAPSASGAPVPVAPGVPSAPGAPVPAAATPSAPASSAAAAAAAADEAAATVAADPDGPGTAARSVPAPSAAAPASSAAGAATARPGDAVMAQLTQLVRDIAEATVSGDHARLRDAVARMGHGLEARLATGQAPDDVSVRTLLAQVAQSPDTVLHTRAMAERAGDAIAAQPLVGQALNQDPSQQSAYLQMPLPGGQTAEVHVNADRDADGEHRGGAGTKVAFVLNMSRLGPLLIEASLGADGVDAAVRSASAPVREYLAGQAGDLAEGLARALPGQRQPHVRVDRMAPNESPAIIPPPPASGLNVSA